MHMADALISPQVGGTMWVVSVGIIAYCSRKLRKEIDSSTIPLMGVMGAFIFAAQMINFTIPVTGSSGHIGGGLILAVLLGPHAAFLTIASVLTVQALFFADGGLMALGCNIFNLGFFPAFVACPFIYRKIVAHAASPARISAASLLSACAGLQLGAFAVVLETTSSGISSLPFTTFAAIMQPIHLAIGIIEGIVTASVISFVYKARPETILASLNAVKTGGKQIRNGVVPVFLIAALITGGFFSWFSSDNPDGLEWSISKVTGQQELSAPKQKPHVALNALQTKTALLPGYSFKEPAETTSVNGKPGEPGNYLGSSVAGIVGGSITLALVLLVGVAIRRKTPRP